MACLRELHDELLIILEYIDKICKENNIRYTLCAGSVLGAVRHKGFIPWDDDLDVMMMRSEYKRFLVAIRNDEDSRFFVQEERKDSPYYFSKVRKNRTAMIERFTIRKKWRSMHQGIYVDVFPVDYASKNFFFRFMQTVCARVLVAQSLLERGYDTATFYKKIIMSLSVFFLPLRNPMFNYVVGVRKEEASSVSTFFADYNKFFPVTLLEQTVQVEFENKLYPIPSDWKKYLVIMYGESWIEPPAQKDIDYKIHAKIFSTTKDYKELLDNYSENR